MCLPVCCWCSPWRSPSTPRSAGSSARRRSGRPARAAARVSKKSRLARRCSLRVRGVVVFDLTLSFDNGPEPDATPRVLDILAARGIKTTFFVIGQKLADPRRRELAARAYGEGHWIGNHTYTHSVPLGRQTDGDAAESEIGRTQGLIGDLAHPNRWFRPFGAGGNLDNGLLKPSVVDYLCYNQF